MIQPKNPGLFRKPLKSAAAFPALSEKADSHSGQNGVYYTAGKENKAGA
jgi:hypothetical protein